ncbi:MAG: signal peptidase I [Longimicrobiales bacterium]
MREAVDGGEGREGTDGVGPSSEGSPSGRSVRRRWSTLGVFWEWTRSVAVAFVLFLVVRTFLVEAFSIPTSSMESTLLVGDFLLVNKAVYGAEIPATDLHLPAFDEPERGDVVVFHPPHDQVRNYVKRVVGVPGDTLEMRDKVLYLNGVGQKEPYARHRDDSGDAVHPSMSWQRGYLLGELHASDETYHPSRDNWGPLVVPTGKYFVLGDNRDNSEDSRYWGFVNRQDIRGRPLFVYYSFNFPTGDQFSWLERVRWNRIGEAIE